MMFKKILVPLDGSKLAAKILPQVADLAKTQDAQVTLLTVYPDLKEAVSGELVEKLTAHEVKSCEGYLAETAKDLNAQGIKAETICTVGMPSQDIIAYAAKNGMDLIAMATHGKGEVAWVLGSVAEKVVTHATVPVLLFRVMGAEPPKTKEEQFLEVLDRGIP
jgi:nucleotide-binding universal stress UspA family protein